jgi:hypothetical protein
MLAYMRSHRRRAAPEQVLIVGLHDDIDAIATTLAQVSPDAYGHVLIAAPPGATDHLTAPLRVAIHRVDPCLGVLNRAITAWAAEWMPDQPLLERPVRVWLGAHAHQHIDTYAHGLMRGAPSHRPAN